MTESSRYLLINLRVRVMVFTTDLPQVTDKHNVVLSTPRLSGIRTLVVIGTHCIGSYKSNYNTMTTMTPPLVNLTNKTIL